MAGLTMAVLSAAVAVSGLALPLPDVVYRAAAELGGLVERLGRGPDTRATPIVGTLILTPGELAERTEGRGSSVPARIPRGASEGPTTRRLPSRARRPRPSMASAARPATRKPSAPRVRPPGVAKTAATPGNAPALTTPAPSRSAAPQATKPPKRAVSRRSKPRPGEKQRVAEQPSPAATGPPGEPDAETTVESGAAPASPVVEPGVAPGAPTETSADPDHVPPGLLPCRESNGVGGGNAHGLCK